MDSLQFASALPVTCSLTSHTSSLEKSSSVIFLPQFENSTMTSITKTNISALTSVMSSYQNSDAVQSETLSAIKAASVKSKNLNEECTFIKDISSTNETGASNTTVSTLHINLPDVETYDTVKTFMHLGEDVTQKTPDKSDGDDTRLPTASYDEPDAADVILSYDKDCVIESTYSSVETKTISSNSDALPKTDFASSSDDRKNKSDDELSNTNTTSPSDELETESYDESSTTHMNLASDDKATKMVSIVGTPQIDDIVSTSEIVVSAESFPEKLDVDHMSSSHSDLSPESPDSIISLHLSDNSEDDFDMEVEEVEDEKQQEDDPFHMEVEEIEDEQQQEGTDDGSETESCNSPYGNDKRDDSSERTTETQLEDAKTSVPVRHPLLQNILSEKDTNLGMIDEIKEIGNLETSKDVANILPNSVTTTSECVDQVLSNSLNPNTRYDPTRTPINTNNIVNTKAKFTVLPYKHLSKKAIFETPTPVFLFPNKNYNKNQIQNRAPEITHQKKDGTLIHSKIASIPVCYGDFRGTHQSLNSPVSSTTKVKSPKFVKETVTMVTPKAYNSSIEQKTLKVSNIHGSAVGVSSRSKMPQVIGNAKTSSTASNLLKSIIQQRNNAPKIDSFGDITSILTGKSFDKSMIVTTTTASDPVNKKMPISEKSKTYLQLSDQKNLNKLPNVKFAKTSATILPKNDVIDLTNINDLIKKGVESETKFSSGMRYELVQTTTSKQTPQLVKVYPSSSAMEKLKKNEIGLVTTSAKISNSRVDLASSKIPVSVGPIPSSTKLQQIETSLRMAEFQRIKTSLKVSGKEKQPIFQKKPQPRKHKYICVPKQTHSLLTKSRAELINVLSKPELKATSTTNSKPFSYITTGVPKTLSSTPCALSTSTTLTSSSLVSKVDPKPSYTFKVYRSPTGVPIVPQKASSSTSTNQNKLDQPFSIAGQPNLVIKPMETTPNAVNTMGDNSSNVPVFSTRDMSTLGKIPSIVSSSNSIFSLINAYNANVGSAAQRIILPQNAIEKLSTIRNQANKNTSIVHTNANSFTSLSAPHMIKFPDGKQTIVFPPYVTSSISSTTTTTTTTSVDNQQQRQIPKSNTPIQLQIVTSKGIVSTTGLFLTSINSNATNSICQPTNTNILSSSAKPTVKTLLSERSKTTSNENPLFAPGGEMSNACVNLLSKYSGFSTSLPVLNKAPLILQRSPVKSQQIESMISKMMRTSQPVVTTTISCTSTCVNVPTVMSSVAESYNVSNTVTASNSSSMPGQVENENQDEPSFIIDSVFSLKPEVDKITKSRLSKDEENFFSYKFDLNMVRFNVKLDEDAKDDSGLRQPCFVVLDDINRKTESKCTIRCRKDVVRKLTKRIMDRYIRRKKGKRKRVFTSRKRRQQKKRTIEPQGSDSSNNTSLQPHLQNMASNQLCSDSSNRTSLQSNLENTASKELCIDPSIQTSLQSHLPNTASKQLFSDSFNKCSLQPNLQNTAFKLLCSDPSNKTFTKSLLHNASPTAHPSVSSNKTPTQSFVQNTVVTTCPTESISSTVKPINTIDIETRSINSGSQTIVDDKGNRFLLLKVDSKTILVPTLNKADQPKAYVIEGSPGASLTKAIKQITEKHMATFSESSSASVLSVSTTTVANTLTNSTLVSTTVDNPMVKPEPQTSGYGDDTDVSIKAEPSERELQSNARSSDGPSPSKIPRLDETPVVGNVSDRIKRLRDELKAREKALEDVRRKRLNESENKF